MTNISTFDILRALLLRLSMVVMWLTFFVFHLTLFVLAVVALWWLRIPPETLVEQLASFAQSLSAALAGLVGLSALTILGLWVKLWRRVYGKVVTPYLFRDIDEYIRTQG
ncbi:MAG TPA: hypothetical protein VEN78_26540 [Bradyrhizobium sp.]|nr:hypothetical protein [Bradyrhizobium sp.]